MKSKLYHLVLLAFAAVFFTACNWLDSSEVEVSSSAHFRSLTFANAVTADAAVKNAKFEVVYDATLRDSFIVNVDSLPYNTAIDSVIPTFSFYSMNGTIVYRNDSTGAFKDSIYLTGTDTLDFRQVFKIKNFASDGKTSVTYRVKVNVHTQNPDLYQWKQLNTSIYSHEASVQKAIYFKKQLLLFTHNGAETYLNKSSNGVSWSGSSVVPSLPDNAKLQSMVVFKDSIYLVNNDNSLYKSVDGVAWIKKSYQAENFVFKNLLFDFKSMLWAIVESKSDSEYRFAHSTNGFDWVVDPSAVIDSNFPVTDFAAVTFSSRTQQPRVLVSGGYNKSGVMLDNVWSSVDGKYWVDFSTENKTYGKRVGSSLIAYEGKLLSIGGVSAKQLVDSTYFIQSADDGLSWKRADTLMWVREQLHDTIYKDFKARRDLSVLLDENKYIYIVGGRDTFSTVQKDVWRGRLNKSVFINK